MSKQWRLTLTAVVACLLPLVMGQAQGNTPASAGSTGAAALPANSIGFNLLDLQVDSDTQGRPVVKLSSDGEIRFESFVLDGPDRLVVDLPGAVSRLDEYRYDVGQGGVARIRAGQHQLEPIPVTRVVFDLEGPLGYEIERDGTSLTVYFGGADPLVGDLSEPQEEPFYASGGAEIAAAMAATEPSPVVEVAQPTPVDDTVVEIERLDSPPEPVKLTLPEPVDAEPVTQTAQASIAESAPSSRSLEDAEIDRLLNSPSFAAPAEPETAASRAAEAFETQTIVTGATTFSGKRISLNLVDADLKQVFRLFHEISGLNFVLDPGVSGRVTIVLDQVPWDQALDLILKNNGLDKVLEGNVLRIAATTKLAQEAAARKQLKEAEELEVEPITLTRRLSYAKAVNVEQVIREGGILSPRGKVIVDERTNTLIINDIPKSVEPVDMLLNTLDTETPQVMIEARIVETARNYSRDLGIVWGFQARADSSRGTTTGVSFPHNTSFGYALNLPGQEASTLAFSLGNVIDSFTLDLAINALESEGNGRILSSPKIATQNNERAEIEQGTRIPIVNTTATEINVEFVSASLRLAVTPQITAEGTIILDIVVENNSPDFVNTAGDIPSISTQRAQTKVLINDGGTTVIGGIFVVNEGVAETGVPWFRKIPVFGWLFKNQEISQDNRELLIFITPKILRLS
jgi:type IV pilus assembly protein PilQ